MIFGGRLTSEVEGGCVEMIIIRGGHACQGEKMGDGMVGK